MPRRQFEALLAVRDALRAGNVSIFSVVVAEPLGALRAIEKTFAAFGSID